MNKNVVIIIVTYNAMQWLPKCLESTKPYPVIIVDNNSQDKTVEFIENNYPDVKLFKQQKNLGFGQANNIGISHALKEGADYVFLLNQDAYLQGDCIEKLVKIHQNHGNYGILSPIHLNGKGDLLDSNFGNYIKANKSFYSDFVLGNPLENIYEVPFVNAAGWLLSKKCLLTVGGFDPIFFHYGEDDNYCQRLKYHNFKIGVVPNTFLKHDREERVKREIKYNTTDYYSNMERSLKKEYADINKTHLADLTKRVKERKLAKLKSFFKLRFQSVDKYNKEILLLEQILAEIKRSRRTNRVPGAHYL